MSPFWNTALQLHAAKQLETETEVLVTLLTPKRKRESEAISAAGDDINEH